MAHLGSVAVLLLGCANSSTPVSERRDFGPPPDFGPPDMGLPDDDGDRVPNDRDCDPSDPSVGATAERTCEGDCGSGLERCSEGAWTECDAPTGAACECTPGDTRELPCERCGTQAQGCSASGVWTDDGSCVGAGPCAPGDLEMDTVPECAGSGRRTRSCTESCTWDDYECDEGPAQLWFFPSGGASWSRFSYGTGPNAPRGAIRAAFSIDDGAEAYVMTDTTFHVLALTTSPPRWVRTGPLGGAGQLPAVVATGGEILFTWSLNDGFFDGGDPLAESLAVVVNVGGETRAFSYGYDAGTREFTRDPDQAVEHPTGAPCCDWTGETGVTPLDPAGTRAQWLDEDNLDRWTDTCAPDADTHAYIGSLSTTGEIATQPICTNLSFSERTAAASFTPFAAADAPPLTSVGATVWSSGLYVFTETP